MERERAEGNRRCVPPIGQIGTTRHVVVSIPSVQQFDDALRRYEHIIAEHHTVKIRLIDDWLHDAISHGGEELDPRQRSRHGFRTGDGRVVGKDSAGDVHRG